MSNNSIRVGFDTERSRAGAFSGSFQTLGTALTVNPAIIIFDNQSDVAVQVSVDAVNVWKTFSAGEAMILDLRGNNALAANYTVDIGTQFYVKATAGTGSFYMSITYAR